MRDLFLRPVPALLALVCLLPLGLRAQPGNAQEEPAIPPGDYVISGLEIEGATFTDPQSIRMVSGLQVGDQISVPGEALGKGLRNLWKQNLFSDIALKVDKIEANRLFLVIQVTERPRISKYGFQNIKKSKAEDLREEINFIRGQRFTQAKRRSAQRIVRNYFHEKGYLNVESSIETKPDESVENGIIVTINVDKGEKVKISEIVINGTNQLSAKKLEKELKETKEKRFYRLWKRSKFIPALWEEDKDRILNYMHSKGYRDAKITRDTVITQDEKNVKLVMNVYEGKQYYFGNINWVGNYKYTDGRLDTLLDIGRGEVYNTELLNQRLMQSRNGTDISSLYLDDGYLFFRAEPVEVAARGDTVDLEMRIYEGPQATYDKIIIEGNDKTSDHVILREIRTIPGDKFSRSEIVRSQREIVNLGYFNPQTIQVIPKPDPQSGTVDIKYIVEEKPSDQLFFQGGWGGAVRDPNSGERLSNGLVGTVGLQFNNFSTRKLGDFKSWSPLPAGDGQKLGLQIQLNGSGFQNYSISFTEPWLGGTKPNSLGGSLSYSIQRQFFSDFRLRIFSSSINYGRRLKWPDDFFRSITSLNYRYYDVQGNTGLIEQARDADRLFLNIVSIKQTIERNSINAPIFPTSGSRISASVEFTPPYSLFRDVNVDDPQERFKLMEFHKWKFRAQGFTRLFGNTVLMQRAEFGFMGLYSQEIGMAPFERFFLGGDGLTGFNLDGREIIALRGYQSPAIGNRQAGNVAYNKFTFELRQPISLKPQATIWLDAFMEAGSAAGDFRQFNPFEMQRSAGGGVRIFLPIFGLLGVDFGYGFDEIPGLQGAGGFQTHFMIGQQF